MEFIYLLVAVAGLVWGTILLRAGGLLAGCLVVLLAGICFGHPFFNVAAGPLPVTIDRLLLGGLLVLAIVYRRLGHTCRLPMTAADWALGGFVLWLAVSTFTHDWHSNKQLALTQLLFYNALPVCLYWIVRQTPIDERGLWTMYAACGVFGIYLAVTSVAETHQWWSLVWPKYIASPDSWEFFGRGRGPLLNPAGSGILQGCCFLAALLWWPRLSRLGKLALVGISPLYAYGIYSTFTRSAWGGLALGLLIVVVLRLPRVWRVPIVGTLLLVSVPVMAWNWEHLLAFKRDKSLSAEEAAESARLRPLLAAVAWEMFLDRPLLGCGYGQYHVECRPYLSDRSIDLPLEKVRPYVQHNVLLAQLVETGLVGMCLFLAAFDFWLREAWRLWRCTKLPIAIREAGLLFLGFSGVWLSNAMFQDVSIIPTINMLLLFLAGMTMNLSLRYARPAEHEMPGASVSPALPRRTATGGGLGPLQSATG